MRDDIVVASVDERIRESWIDFGRICGNSTAFSRLMPSLADSFIAGVSV
jgi:hypothetical protein